MSSRLKLGKNIYRAGAVTRGSRLIIDINGHVVHTEQVSGNSGRIAKKFNVLVAREFAKKVVQVRQSK